MELTKQEQRLCDFLEDNPGCTQVEASRAIFASAGVFDLLNLSGILYHLRKKDFLYFSVDQRIWLATDERTPLPVRLKIQDRVGKRTLSYLKNSLTIMRATNDPEQIKLGRTHLKEAARILVEGRIINLKGAERFGRVKVPRLR